MRAPGGGWFLPVLIMLLADCGARSPSVPAEIVNVPPEACVGAIKWTCNNDKVFVKKEWVTTDCKLLPIDGFSFDHCSASKIYRYSFPGRGTSDMQSYGAMLIGPRQSTVVSYSKLIAGDIAGVTPVDEATLLKGLQGGGSSGGVVGRLGDDFEAVTEQRMISDGKIISHTGDTFIYGYDSGLDHCKAFLTYGPAEWSGYLRRWAAEASICNRTGVDVSLDDITRLQSQLVFQ